MKNYYSKYFLNLISSITEEIDYKKIEKLTFEILKIKKKNGRIFFLGVGGSAANCSHAVNDFRKICNIEAYTPSDNVAELTARINDEGWETSMSEWLKVSKLSKKDALFVFSVGGGNKKKSKHKFNFSNRLCKKKGVKSFWSSWKKRRIFG